ncbi:SDR family NAD(P)-dependent oxidoreductase [Cellulomonas shaoxiangyii]|uniref:SDR family NAD(P)-dependent oxidoreductase n=1 Tax=Cellulomonas shaoxiangyii TaxID=2566013 RepID=A0A4V1CMI6_9CELL|nr:SDR family NAD(P)-dependent oxidoreductase [Cellulomonas shaoxiangyii]QCB93075.1 SDR family NAD(P)-dependent oxidoreductase [Cellulomonas shaoxiangyii]TGY78798.1 SDR family NAD(P)-dependent oxidoreductase [Cellulomonas shaoxiangyii]
MENDLTDLTVRPLALVTGASSGIGLELARELAERGFDLLVTAENPELTLAADGLAQLGTAVRAVQADLTTADGVQTLLDEVAAVARPIDVAALNAGRGDGGAFLEIPLENDLATVQLNIVANVRLAKGILPAMVQRGAGRVLITSSTGGLMPGPGYATYAASKAFLTSFAEALRHELKDTGVTVTALLPGPTDTDFFEQADMVDTVVGQGSKDDPADVARRGVEALLDGKDKVEANTVKARMQSAMAAVLPDTAKAAMHAGMTKPTGEKAERSDAG